MTGGCFFFKVQMEMYVCKTEYADFITWTPRQSVIFRVKRDESFISEALDTISRFWARHVYPMLAGVLSELEHQVHYFAQRMHYCDFDISHI